MSSNTSTGGSGGGGGYENPHVAPQITFYTFPDCPYCQRVHILLTELALPFDEVLVDISKPREQWYLDINPRGLVPSLKFSNGAVTDEILTESAIIAQFLADSRPSHVLPATLASPSAPLRRARVQLYADAFMSALGGHSRALLFADAGAVDAMVDQLLDAVGTEVEPLLHGTRAAAPFLGGVEAVGLAEILTAPFLLRLYALSGRGVVPQALKQGLQALPLFGRWAEAVMRHPSVVKTWDEESFIGRAVAAVEKLKGEAAAKA
ncbi:thioredoxin-like protein [Phyllosticta citribraziliensis]|uniref:Thioredoxin-like protein n=1 Tax=Phyllosticta citribraziliensis TaxID=989973 RepID=A0ABR1M3A1_9PEZI